jgi:OFA family oxalate/formate antiporter-like MFS transporter
MMAFPVRSTLGRCLPKPLLAQFGRTLSQLQIAFSVLIVLQSFLSPFQGFLMGRGNCRADGEMVPR